VFVHIFTEDGYDSQSTIEAILKRLFVAAFGPVNTSAVQFHAARPLHRKMLSGNSWQSSSRQDQRLKTDLINEIANLTKMANTFVVFHYDGDRPWAAKHSAVLPAKFDELTALIRSQHRDAQRRIIPLVPFYAMESWVYQDIEGCRRNGGNEVMLSNWSADRGALDEVVRPHLEMPFGKKNNAELAKGLTNAVVSEVVAAQKSLAAAVSAVRQCSDLRLALERL
jgi:hypothetical protein